MKSEIAFASPSGSFAKDMSKLIRCFTLFFSSHKPVSSVTVQASSTPSEIYSRNINKSKLSQSVSQAN
eukprot:m.112292 g.112292  ORF g.112292 m.112292 type:complete len:68 (-) comp28182_c0_seq3:256-459(-)